jgi:hypothetical protein
MAEQSKDKNQLQEPPQGPPVWSFLALILLAITMAIMLSLALLATIT